MGIGGDINIRANSSDAHMYNANAGSVKYTDAVDVFFQDGGE